jgi:hypothetical protein
MMLRLARTLFLVVLLVLVALLLWNALKGFRWSKSELRDAIVTTLQSEAPASFYVTGELEVTATVTSSDTKYLIPAPFLLNLGTTEATVRVPGRVSYGFDVRSLQTEDITFGEGDSVVVSLPGLSVYAVDPDMSRLEMRTRVGWARTHAGSGHQQEKAALARVRDALRVQGEQYLRSSIQPRVHTAEAVTLLLRPVLHSAGIEDPQIEVRIGREPVPGTETPGLLIPR